MKKITNALFIGLCLGILSTCKNNGRKEQTTFTNHLAESSSPYLLQHAQNPVDWYPWGETALKKARKDNKLLIVSIGYAACHWCHVMEEESFEDTTVAQLMNEHFVSIKVDREERPDIDQIYMDAAQILTGRGGWPLNAIALPDGRPVFAGTYFEKDDWLNILQRIATKYKDDPMQFEQVAEQVTQGIQGEALVNEDSEPPNFSQGDLELMFANWEKSIDFKNGGLQGAPKFPMPNNQAFLLNYYFHKRSPRALKAVELSLEKMANGGIYDHLGGGFSRYSTDAEWFAPHFEKMLYDNAQLVSLYAKAYRFNQNPIYKKVVYETLDFVERELTSPEGAFFTSLNADSEGEEGRFYTWKKSELDKVLGDKATLLNEYFGVKENGNWEAGWNILRPAKEVNSLLTKYNLEKSAFEAQLKEAKEQLWRVREKRERPSLDDKVLTSWNALMISGYTEAYRSFGDEKFLQVAIKNAKFLQDKVLQEDGKLFRNYKDGKAGIPAFLDDYANLIKAFTDLYQVTFEKAWLYEAEKLTEYALGHFNDTSTGLFYYTSAEDQTLIARKIELQDNVMPASNSQMAQNLFVLGTLFYKENYIKKAEWMLNHIKKDMIEYGAFHSNWAMLLLDFLHPPYEVAIVGKNAETLRKEMSKQFLPNALFLGGKNEGELRLLSGKLIEGETMIYVCQDKVCKRPTAEVKGAVQQLVKAQENSNFLIKTGL